MVVALVLFAACRELPSAAPEAELEIAVGVAPTGVTAVGSKIAVGEVGFDFGTLSFDIGMVRWIDPASARVVGATEVGINPQVVVAAGADRDLLAAICTGDYGAVEGEVAILDPISMRVERRISLSGYPAAACAGPGDLVYVGSFGDQGVAAVDVAAGVVVRDWSPGAGFEAAAVAARGEGVLAADFDSDLLVHLDADGSVLDAIAVGDGPVDLVVDPTDSDRIYVLHTLEETLGIVRLRERSFTRLPRPVGRAPNDVEWHRGLLWVVASLSNLVQSWDPASGELDTAVHLGVNRNPMQLTFFGDSIFVTNLLSNSVSTWTLP